MTSTLELCIPSPLNPPPLRLQSQYRPPVYLIMSLLCASYNNGCKYKCSIQNKHVLSQCLTCPVAKLDTSSTTSHWVMLPALRILNLLVTYPVEQPTWLKCAAADIQPHVMPSPGKKQVSVAESQAECSIMNAHTKFEWVGLEKPRVVMAKCSEYCLTIAIVCKRS